MTIHETFYTSRFRSVTGFYRQKQAGQQVEFIEKVVPLRKGHKVLDLACGFGRHAVLLAQKGYDVTGYDLSEDYIREAQEAAQAAGVKACFHRVDMRELDPPEQFDAILSLSTSLAFYNDATNLDILRRIRDALKSGGVFVWDQANIFSVIPTLVWDKKEDASNPSDGRAFRRELTFDPATCILSMRGVLEEAGERHETGWDIRYYTLPELWALFEQLGLRIGDTYGDYDSSAFELRSARLITTAVKT